MRGLADKRALTPGEQSCEDAMREIIKESERTLATLPTTKPG